MSDPTLDRKFSRVRETRSCAVPTCKNKRVGRKDDSGPSFHRFPKDPAIRRSWIDQCKLGDSFSPDNASVCSDHFEFEDFERSYQKQLMGIERRPMLKKNVVPHLNLPSPTRRLRGVNGELKNHFKSDVKDCEIEIKTIEMQAKHETTPVEAIILGYESDIESLCVQSVEDNMDSQANTSLPIENIQIEPDYKALYLQTLEKYEKLESKVTTLQQELEHEKKRVNDYQSMLTKIFAEGEIHLLHKKEEIIC